MSALADQVAAQLGFPPPNACVAFLNDRWGRIGLPVRGREETKTLNRKHGHHWNHRLTRRQLQAAHELHMKRDLSVNELGRQLHQRYGYKTPASCAAAITAGWKLLGLRPRDRIAMTVAVSTIHGQCRRDAKSSDKKRFLQERKGRAYKRLCAAKTKRGKPCRHLAQIGQTVCHSHDQGQRAELTRRVAAMRARSTLHINEVPAGDLPGRLTDWFEGNGRRWAPLTDISGKTNTNLSRQARRQPGDLMKPAMKQLLERALDEATTGRLQEAA